MGESCGESDVKVYSFQLRVKSVWEIRASLTPEGKRWRHFRGHFGPHQMIFDHLCCKKCFLFSCSLVNSLLIARNFHIFASEIFIENQQVTL